ncbi:hypothetical protein [Bradyrhizobium liaoningense]|uniref:hypothetical protein n=1 Tax=Bradyrhizobium liaoningense TaxID=43992 RepID=UPI001BAD13F5|nr:hypothetical protein [Bradyrhizobium liaoningense]MBR0710140.1 hypothetical protein [Bradyrhizobium liaoningense]
MTHDDFMSKLLKEQRAENFQKPFDHVPIRPEQEFLDVMDKQIGGGTTREVFSVRGRDDVVIKRVKAVTPFNNWCEYIVWNAARATRWASVLAAVEMISHSGQYLMMERLSPLSADDTSNAPNVPYWLNDLKIANFGKTSGGAIKALDYAHVNLGFDLDEALPWQVPWRNRTD